MRSRFVVANLAVCSLVIVGFDIALWVLSWIAGLAVRPNLRFCR